MKFEEWINILDAIKGEKISNLRVEDLITIILCANSDQDLDSLRDLVSRYLYEKKGVILNVLDKGEPT